RVMFPFILLVSLAAWAMGVLNSLKHFSIPASASIFLNLGIILGAVGLSRVTNPPVLGLAIGVLLGGALQLGVHFPILKRFGFFPKLTWRPKDPGVKKIIGMMVPSAFGAAVYQFNVIVVTLLASFLPSGSVSYLWYADRLMEFPLGIFAISMATVLLPSLSEYAARKDIEGLKETFRFGLRIIFFITLPAAGGLIVLSEPIIRIIYQHGSFSPESTRMTAQALIFFSLGLPFISGVRVTSNAFFSLQDAKTPVKAASLAVVVNLVLSLLLMKPMAHNGLALAISLSAVFNFIFQLIDFRKKVGQIGLRKVIGGLSRTSLSTIGMMTALYFMKGRFPVSIFSLSFEIVAGVATFVVFEYLLRGQEVHEMIGLLKRKATRASAVPPSLDE
ncbi:MAG: murein biosynthesis integral membrane protein MurJ, partial [Deltaproteobacteria bacterium]|nr:murein biosynthesis integral membrane protein MurJ [Deltaproteobacteria bacterium]